MNHTLYLTTVFCFYRKTVAAISHGDYRILQISPGRAIHHGIQLCMDFVIHLADGAADTLQCRTGIVTDLIFG